MKQIDLNEKQIMILRDLLLVEEEYLKTNAMPTDNAHDSLELKHELTEVESMLEKLK